MHLCSLSIIKTPQARCIYIDLEGGFSNCEVYTMCQILKASRNCRAKPEIMEITHIGTDFDNILLLREGIGVIVQLK